MMFHINKKIRFLLIIFVFIVINLPHTVQAKPYPSNYTFANDVTIQVTSSSSTLSEISDILEFKIGKFYKLFDEAFEHTNLASLPSHDYIFNDVKKYSYTRNFTIRLAGIEFDDFTEGYVKSEIGRIRRSFYQGDLDSFQKRRVIDQNAVINFESDFLISTQGNFTGDRVSKYFEIRLDELAFDLERDYGITNLYSQVRLDRPYVFFQNNQKKLRDIQYRIPWQGERTVAEIKEYYLNYASLIVARLRDEHLSNEVVPNPNVSWKMNEQNSPEYQFKKSTKRISNNITSALTMMNPQADFSTYTNGLKSDTMKRTLECSNDLNNNTSEVEKNKAVLTRFNCIVGNDHIIYSHQLSYFCNKLEPNLRNACFTIEPKKYQGLISQSNDIGSQSNLVSIEKSLVRYLTETEEGKVKVKFFEAAYQQIPCLENELNVEAKLKCVGRLVDNSKGSIFGEALECLSNYDKNDIPMGAEYFLCGAQIITKDEDVGLQFTACILSSKTDSDLLSCTSRLPNQPREIATATEFVSCYLNVSSEIEISDCLSAVEPSNGAFAAFAIANCLVSDGDKWDKVICATEGRVGKKEAEAISFINCQLKSKNNIDRISCAAPGNFGEREKQIVAFAGCLSDADGDYVKSALCATHGNLGKKEQEILDKAACAYQSSSYAGAAICLLSEDQFTAEQIIYLDCVTYASGGPWAYAGCVGGKLAANEIMHCLEEGFGVGEKCFGKNNFFRQNIENIRREACNLVGEGNEACRAISFIVDNTLLPGKNHELNKYLNGAVNDLSNGPGPNNEFRIVAESAAKILQRESANLTKLFQNPGEFVENAFGPKKLTENIVSELNKAVPKITIKVETPRITIRDKDKCTRVFGKKVCL